MREEGKEKGREEGRQASVEIRKEIIKLFADDMSVYIENLTESKKKTFLKLGD